MDPLVLVEWLTKHGAQEYHVITGAPIAFTSAIVVLGVIIFFFLRAHFRQEIHNLHSAIMAQGEWGRLKEEQLENARNKINELASGASDEVRLKLANIRQLLEPQLSEAAIRELLDKLALLDHAVRQPFSPANIDNLRALVPEIDTWIRAREAYYHNHTVWNSFRECADAAAVVGIRANVWCQAHGSAPGDQVGTLFEKAEEAQLQFDPKRADVVNQCSRLLQEITIRRGRPE